MIKLRKRSQNIVVSGEREERSCWVLDANVLHLY